MKCPACESEVPSGRSACERCGVPFPSVGEPPPGPPPRSFFKPRNDSPPAPANPGTEPLPAWDTDEEPAWGRPPDRPYLRQYAVPPVERPGGWGPGAAMPGPGPDEPGPGTRDPQAPWAGPTPPPGPDLDGWGRSGPPADGASAPAGGRAGNKRKLLLAGGIAAAAVLAGGLAYGLTRGSGQQAPTSAAGPGAQTAAQQAAAADRILGSGKAARGHLPGRLRTCDDVSAGVAGFEQVVQDRQQELAQSQGLKVDRLPGGARLRQAMIAAYRSSLTADQAYTAWAHDVQGRNCGGRIAPLTAHYRDAIAANGKAGPAKRKVAALWKPIATGHGLTAYAWNNL